jgi:molybdopterin synthase catalytic subunit
MSVGEVSVAIAVSAEHRGDAFEACRYAIDTIKKTVPLWKKEISDSGSRWVKGVKLESHK